MVIISEEGGPSQHYGGTISRTNNKRKRGVNMWSFLPDPRKLAKQAVHWGVKTFDPHYSPAAWKRTANAYDALTTGDFKSFGKQLAQAPKVQRLSNYVKARLGHKSTARITGAKRRAIMPPKSSRALTVPRKRRYIASGNMAVGKRRKSYRKRSSRKRTFKKRRY